MYLLACAQDDYADEELKSAKNQFRVKGAFGVPPSAAQSAGFTMKDLIKQNYLAQVPGQFVLETRGCNDLMLAPQYDLKKKLQRLVQGSVQEPFNIRSTTVQEAFTRPALQIVNGNERSSELRSDRSTEVQKLREMGWGKQAIIEKVWNVTKGGSRGYKDAEAEYHQIIATIEAAESEEA